MALAASKVINILTILSEKRLLKLANKDRYKFSGIGFELLGILILIALWFIAGWIFVILPSTIFGTFSFLNPLNDAGQFSDFLPIPTFKALYELIFQDRFWFSVGASLRRVFIGISIAAIIGIPLGLVTGFYPILRNIAYAPIQFLRMVSPLAWMPIALIVFKAFESAICFLIFMATVWPIILNTASGAANVNPSLIKMAMNQGANHSQIFFTIILPASLPTILSSIRLAIGVAWIVLVPAEFLGVASGLGYLINDARDTMSYDSLMAIIVAIGILGFTFDKIFQTIQRTFSRSWIE
ncbi:MAG: ABC transporter permease [Desulfamplus sp.]|nr:ABC transporter permease [Desulfamplus sp.]MBF0242758.1 ABC transporter permease [Desulfamplus sp.]MBF0389545.1 ABC transporter permease [Desulfamplus sp.]